MHLRVLGSSSGPLAHSPKALGGARVPIQVHAPQVADPWVKNTKSLLSQTKSKEEEEEEEAN